MSPTESLVLRCANETELESIWKAAYDDPVWKEFDGPYFPWSRPSLEAFEAGLFRRLKAGDDARVIEVEGHIAGDVSAHWEDENTRWLEVGIALYRAGNWGKGIGRRALSLWTTHLFKAHELERIGLTTWSGNERMVRCALAVGYQLEGRLRKCRFYKGVYYDSMKLGVLRSEWPGLEAP